ncbi:VOC family protein [Halorubrum cibi]|uniref:Glyoxalase family protein n=1 Tax=Halorubrum cibi TaxID=413815 RepID=A0A521CWQ5_9EURY|nr:VOC family protein [Halorubrum cibi]SMO63838.1 glyoxalase family protein [Halorubrum cibi]
MTTQTPGVHHVTGIVGDAQASVDFYAGALGLRLLRTTVNYEDRLQHHLYFGTDDGRPGSVLTVFPDPTGAPGRPGKPGYESVSLAVPRDSLEYWHDRLTDRGVDVERIRPDERFGDRGFSLSDPAGTAIELVATDDPSEPWSEGSVPESAAIRGLYGATATPTDPYGAASVLETLGFEYEAETGDRIRYRAPGERATAIDLLDRDAPYLREGPGTLHHVAVRLPDREALLGWHDLFRERGYEVSRVKDRHFFHSLYVRGPGGLLVELATEAPTPDGPRGPGLDDPDTSGHATDLYLPDRFAEDRSLIEGQLPRIEPPSRR